MKWRKIELEMEMKKDRDNQECTEVARGDEIIVRMSLKMNTGDKLTHPNSHGKLTNTSSLTATSVTTRDSRITQTVC